MRINPAEKRNMKEAEKAGIARRLKQAPDFAIQGTPFGKALNIDYNKGYVRGMYFVVGEEEKRLADEVFIERLELSVGNALGFSSKIRIEGNEARFQGNPSLVLCVDNGRYERRGARGKLIHPSVVLEGRKAGLSEGYTFPIGEGLIRDYIDVLRVVMKNGEIRKVSDELQQFCQYKRLFGTFEQDLFVYKLVIDRMVKKIDKTLRKVIGESKNGRV